MSGTSDVLFVAATGKEISGLTGGSLLPAGWQRSPSHEHVHFLVTGVGMAATCARLSAVLAVHPFRRVINVGLCGSLRSEISPPAVLEVVRDEFVDLGVQDHEAFLSVFDLQLTDRNEFPFENGFLTGSGGVERLPFPGVTGCTVNCAHGHGPSIAALKGRTDAMVESMEGAAVFYSCRLASVPCIQLRAVSNFVEPRNRASWKVEEALSALWGGIKEHWEIITT